jgi:glycosyltransferase involved in cell wall biosynthesis
MKILEVCTYSKGGCGVFARAIEEGKRLAKKNEVVLFSSYFEKGTNKIVKRDDKIDNVVIKRFPGINLGGESFMYWNFIKDALRFEPDVIIAHNYRHLHTLQALAAAKILRKRGKRCSVFLVTHAPFVEGNITRTSIAKFWVWLYDWTVGRLTLNLFDKILAISNWEIPYLLKCGAKRSKITYIPNGIPEEFFGREKAKEENKILFLGRIAPKKKLETLIEAMALLNDKKVMLEIVGPPEPAYHEKLKDIVKRLGLEKKVRFSEPVYEIKEKIKKIDSAKVYVLPSRVEGMPQSLIEAMARGKIVIGSDSIAIRDLIMNGKNGYLFKFNDSKSLARVIDKALSEKTSKIKDSAKKYAEKFSWNKVIKQIERVIDS